MWHTLTPPSCSCPAGSPLISRTSWQALLAAQGFQHVLVSGCDVPALPLLARQSVVLGVSDGVIRRPDFAAVTAARARRPAAAPTHMQPAIAAPAAASGPDVALILQVSNFLWVVLMWLARWSEAACRTMSCWPPSTPKLCVPTGAAAGC
jgi:hypothetical protein